MHKLYLVLMIPFILVAIVIDIAIGDFITGVRVSVKQKVDNHYNQWVREWGESNE